MAYSELVKSFERIRNYMREFYVYGFKSRDEYGMKSARSYDNERRRIESWLGDYMSFHQESSGKKVFLSMDSRRVPCNPLYKAFKAKSFTVICTPFTGHPVEGVLLCGTHMSTKGNV